MQDRAAGGIIYDQAYSILINFGSVVWILVGSTVWTLGILAPGVGRSQEGVRGGVTGTTPPERSWASRTASPEGVVCARQAPTIGRVTTEHQGMAAMNMARNDRSCRRLSIRGRRR